MCNYILRSKEHEPWVLLLFKNILKLGGTCQGALTIRIVSEQ